MLHHLAVGDHGQGEKRCQPEAVAKLRGVVGMTVVPVVAAVAGPAVPVLTGPVAGAVIGDV
jgi:hypothetical protein